MKRTVILGSDESIRRELAEAIAGRTFKAGPIPALQSRAAGVPEAPDAPVPATAPSGPAADAPASRDARRPVAQAAASPGVSAVTGSLKDIARHAAREAERELIFRTLQHTRWNRREAAEILGISYKALLYKIKEAELDKAA